VTSVYHANTEHNFAEQPNQTKICTEATHWAPHRTPLPSALPLTHFNACLQSAAGFISWTPSLQRLYCLVSRCVAAGEPVLLIGETGAGKTTVCQLLSLLQRQPLSILNCHAYTETADFLGGYRPTLAAQRSAGAPAFEWMDGPLLSTMRQGAMFLVDELSLAEDGVLERLNSALEPSRTITLAERAGGPAGSADVETITAAPGWRLLATMNPGGDFGKRELSPALRNRFTEIWVPSAMQREDLLHLITPRLKGHTALLPVGDALVDFWCVSCGIDPRSRLSSVLWPPLFWGVVYDDHIAGRFSNHSQARTR
jgi:midasin (ATPase involved in ribosome maturation)